MPLHVHVSVLPVYLGVSYLCNGVRFANGSVIISLRVFMATGRRTRINAC